MSRMTLAALHKKATYANVTMSGGYFIKVSQRNGYTALDLYNDRGMVDNLLCGTPKECGLVLDTVYKLRRI